jgi:hypothetical protein
VALTVSLVDRFDAVMWQPIAKDGAALSAELSVPRLARQLVSVGETYDFAYTPAGPRSGTPGGFGNNLWIDVNRGNGEWVMQARAVVR